MANVLEELLDSLSLEELDRLISLAFVDKSWDGSASRYADTAAYCNACLVNDNTGPSSEWKQEKCHLPYKEPNGDVNRNALKAIRGAMSGARGASGYGSSENMAKLKRLYAQAGMDWGGGDGPKAAEDEDEGAVLPTDPDYSTLVSLRLADGDAIPAWQVFHRIGDWGTHPRFGQITFTRKMGNQIIENFRKNVLGRDVPLDAVHLNDKGGAALGWAEDFAWGREREGLPGGKEPSGKGDILYVKMRYTPPGVDAIQSELYHHQSPQYHPNYKGNGAVAYAMAATNSPFLRHNRTLQGKEQQPVTLDDGLAGWKEQGMADDKAIELEEKIRSLEERAAAADERAKASEAALLLRDRELHAERVESWADKQRALIGRANRPVPESSIRKATAILLKCEPRMEGVIALDEAAPDDKVNLYDAVVNLTEELLGLAVGASDGYPRGSDRRPGNRTVQPGAADVQLSEDEQREIDEAIDFVANLGAYRGGRPQNGNGHSA